MQILMGPILLAVGLALVMLVLAALRSGRPGDRVRIAAGLGRQADVLVSRSRNRVAVGLVVALLVFWVVLVATLEPLNGLPAWSAAFLASAGAGSTVVALMGAPREAAAPVRTAELTVRTARGFGPGWAFTVPAALTGLLVAALIASMVVADASDGRDVLTWSIDNASGSAGPYPGWRTGLPLLVLLTAAGALFALALRRVAGWPRPVESGLFALDDDVRRATTRMLLLGATGALLGALGTFGCAAAGIWQNVLSNQRSAVSDLTGAALADPSMAESTWRAVQVGGLAIWLMGLALMASAAVAGVVRSPQSVDVAAPVDGSEAVG